MIFGCHHLASGFATMTKTVMQPVTLTTGVRAMTITARPGGNIKFNINSPDPGRLIALGVRTSLGQLEHDPRRLESRETVSKLESMPPSRLLGSIWSTVISIPTLSSQEIEGTATLSTIHGICQKRVAWSRETLSSRWICCCLPKLEQYHAWHSCTMNIRNGVFTPAKFRTPIPASTMTTGLASAIALQGVRWRHYLEGSFTSLRMRGVF